MWRQFALAAVAAVSISHAGAFQVPAMLAKPGLGLQRTSMPVGLRSARGGRPNIARAQPALSSLSMKRAQKNYSPFDQDAAAGGWLSSPASQKTAYAVLALNWIFAAFLHIAVFSFFVTASVANHALYALAYGHFSLVVSALSSLQGAAKNGLLKSATYARLNVGLALSGVAGLGILLWPTIYNFATASGWVLKILPQFSNSPLAVFATSWTVGLLFVSTVVPQRIWNLGFSRYELKGLSISASIMNTVSKFFSPSSFSGMVYRIAAVFIGAQLLAAVFAPSAMLSITGSAALASSELGVHAMKLWAASLVFQLMTVCAVFSAEDYLERGATYKKLSLGFALTFALQAFTWTVASIPYATKSLNKPAVTKFVVKREPSVITFIEDASLEPEVAKEVAEAQSAAKTLPEAKKMTIWEEAMVEPTKFYNNEMPKLLASAKDLANNQQLMVYNGVSIALALYCALERVFKGSSSKESRTAEDTAGGVADKSGDELFRLAVSSFKQGELTTASQYLEACSQKWSDDGLLSQNTAYAQALNDIADRIMAAGGPQSSQTLVRMDDSRENYLTLANNCVEEATAAMDAGDMKGAANWWDQAEMWYGAAEQFDTIEPAK